jgi:hypothetical protein
VPDVALRPRSDDHRAGAASRPDFRNVELLLQAQPGGQLVTSLRALAGSGTLPALYGARRALQELDVVDYEVSADVREVVAETLFEIVWTPVTAVVDLMLDWDLPELEITLTELAEWLDVEVAVALRAVDLLAGYAGVTVGMAEGETVVVRLDLDTCPLTWAPRQVCSVTG